MQEQSVSTEDASPTDDVPPIRSIWIDATGLGAPLRPLKLPKTPFHIRKARYVLNQDSDTHIRGSSALVGYPNEVSLWYYQPLPDYKRVSMKMWGHIIPLDEIQTHRRVSHIIIHGYGTRRSHFLSQDEEEVGSLHYRCKIQPPKPLEYETIKQVARFLRIGSVWRVQSWDEIQEVLDWVGKQSDQWWDWAPFPDTWPLDRMPDECWYPPEWGIDFDKTDV